MMAQDLPTQPDLLGPAEGREGSDARHPDSMPGKRERAGNKAVILHMRSREIINGSCPETATRQTAVALAPVICLPGNQAPV